MDEHLLCCDVYQLTSILLYKTNTWRLWTLISALLLAVSSLIMTCWLICKCKNHRTARGSNLTHVAQNNGPEDLQYCILSASSTPGVLSVSNLQSFFTYLPELLENFLTIEDPALCSAASDDNNNDKVRRTSFSSSTDK